MRKIKIIKSLECSADDERHFRTYRSEIDRYSYREYVIREHGFLSSWAICARLYARLPIPDNVVAVLVSGNYAKERLLEAGLPSRIKVLVLGRVLFWKPIRMCSKPMFNFFLPVHSEKYHGNREVAEIIKAACIPVVTKFARKQQDCPDYGLGRTTKDWDELGKCRFAISARPFQTVAALTIGHGIPTALYVKCYFDRWPGEREYHERFFGPLLGMQLPFFEDARELRYRMCEPNYYHGDLAWFMEEVIGPPPKMSLDKVLQDIREGKIL